MAIRLIVDQEKCSSCRICEQICTFSHYQEFNPKRSRIKVALTEKEGLSTPRVCNRCRKCIAACPKEAIYWDSGLRIVLVDTDKCMGCKLCVESCPQMAIFMDSTTGKANICDLCGGDPQCAKWCPEGAIRYQ